MSRYSKYAQKPKERPWEVHPIWRGIGCLMILIIPIMAYAGADLLVKANMQQSWLREANWAVELMRTQVVPVIYYPVPHLYANLAVAFVLTVLGYGLMMFFYTIMYSAMGPPRLGPLDAPPERRRRPKKKFKARR